MTETLTAPPTHVSYSQISSWVRCGKAFELERIIRVPSTPTWAQVAGNAVHTGTELLDKGAADPIRDIWLDVFASTIEEHADMTSTSPEEWRATGRRTKDKPRGEDYKFWQREGAIMLNRWKSWRLANSHLQIASLAIEGSKDTFDGVELSLVVKFGDVVVKGFVDRVFVDERTDELVVVDLKSGAYTPKDAGQQLGLYATGIEQLFGVRPRTGAYWMARSGAFSEPLKDLSHFSEHYWTSMVQGFHAAKTLGIYLPNPGMFCGSCSVKDYCATQGGHLAALADSLSTDS